MEVMDAEADLLEVVGTLGAVGRLPHLLHRRQEQGDQDANDGNDHQQLDEGEAAASGPELRHGLYLRRMKGEIHSCAVATPLAVPGGGVPRWCPGVSALSAEGGPRA